MDTHRLLMNNLFKLTGVKLEERTYCYCEKEGKKYIELELTRSQYNDLYRQRKVLTHEFIFRRKRKYQEENGDKIVVGYEYESNPKLDLTSKIDTGEKQYGAIDPKGNFYVCGYAGHNLLEHYLCEHNLLQENDKDAFSFSGWMKLTGAMMTTVEFIFNFVIRDYNFSTREDKIIKENKLTKEQINAVVSYIKSQDRCLVNFNYSWYNIEDFEKYCPDNIEDFDDFEDKYGIKYDLPKEEEWT